MMKRQILDEILQLNKVWNKLHCSSDNL